MTSGALRFGVGVWQGYSTHRLAELARLVEEEIGHGKLTQGLADGAGIELEPFLPARLGRERSGQ